MNQGNSRELGTNVYCFAPFHRARWHFVTGVGAVRPQPGTLVATGQDADILLVERFSEIRLLLAIAPKELLPRLTLNMGDCLREMNPVTPSFQLEKTQVGFSRTWV
jgi:hypothetical protein